MVARRVPDGAAGTRLDRFLAGLGEVGTRAAAEALIARGGVTVDGSPRAKSHRLAGGEEVCFEPPPAAPEVAFEPIDVPVAHEDEHLLVVDKPAGLVVHPGAGRSTGTLVHALHGRIAGGDDPERPGIVHRLDRDTSGLMVVARSQEAYERLREQVRRHELERTYLALVKGKPRSRRGTIEAPIGRDRFEPTRRSLDSETPKDAVTHFEVEQSFDGFALLRVRLETGRMHQIRVHLAAIDLPVLGDPTYGVSDERLDRQFLHATALAFAHPFTGERLELDSPLPPDLRQVLGALS
ncbi:MAG TPA: RluA family pseudouridine synthase [Gaiellaceae bacterium]|nr:RluA family pseudouridine synthase [Gaiellaceae bacterium]